MSDINNNKKNVAFMIKLNNKFQLELDKVNCAKLTGMLKSECPSSPALTDLVEATATAETSLPRVLLSLADTGRITSSDCSLLTNTLTKLGRPDLVAWLHDEELSSLLSGLDMAEMVTGSGSKTSSALTTTSSSTKASSIESSSQKHLVDINGVRVSLKFRPHKFQVNLSKNGCDGLNNIVCVRTGSGKTLIAAIICKYWCQKLGDERFHAAFIVPTRYLANQQMNAFIMAGFEVCF